MDTKNAHTILLSVRKIHIKLHSQTQLCVSREPFPPFSTCDTLFSTYIFFPFWIFALDFFVSLHLHVCLICGLFCRVFFFLCFFNFIHRWICSVFWNLFLLTFRSYAFFLSCMSSALNISFNSFDRSIQWLMSFLFFPLVILQNFFMVPSEVEFPLAHHTTRPELHILNMMQETQMIWFCCFSVHIVERKKRRKKKCTYCAAN